MNAIGRWKIVSSEKAGCRMLCIVASLSLSLSKSANIEILTCNLWGIGL